MSNNDSPTSKVYAPQVAAEKKPKVKQEFQTIEEAFTFYNAYARECGFSARMNNSRKKKKEPMRQFGNKLFALRKEKQMNIIRKIVNSWLNDWMKGADDQFELDAKLRLHWNNDKTGPNWIISTFIEEHNHVFATPTKIHLLRSHRNVSAAKRVLSQQLSKANMPTCQQIRVMEIESGGAQNIGLH